MTGESRETRTPSIGLYLLLFLILLNSCSTQREVDSMSWEIHRIVETLQLTPRCEVQR